MIIDWKHPWFLTKLFTLAGIGLLVLCLLSIVFESRLPSLFPPTPASAGPSNCQALLDKAATVSNPETPEEKVRSASDNAGILRIAGTWPQTIRLGDRLCLVLAGVAPKADADRLRKVVEDRTEAVKEAQDQYDAATADANKAKDSARTSEASNDPEPSKAKARKDRDEATKKQAEQQKKLTDANDALSTALAAANRGLPAIEIGLFLNERRLPQTLKANAIPGPQLLVYEFGQTADADSDDAKFWRGLMAGKTKGGLMSLRVGVSKSQGSGPDPIDRTPINFRVYWPLIVGLGAASMILLFAAFAIYAANSAILRDHALTNIQLAAHNAGMAKDASASAPQDAKLAAAAAEAETEASNWQIKAGANEPAGTFSLGRTQMALWLVLSTAGFVFIWLTLGLYKNVVTEAILVLLGINSATGLAAIIIEKGDISKPTPKGRSTGFWTDLASDGEGAKLQRIQVIVWTCILAVIFTWNVIANFAFVQFDTYLLLLMGIANTTYLGFKPQEKPAKS
jgi:hypothetical protein